jgi:Tol biopolymer transport system component
MAAMRTYLALATASFATVVFGSTDLLAQGRGGGRFGRGGGAAADQGAAAPALPAGKRALALADMYRVRTLGNLQISPDGEWVMYTVAQLDSVRDRSESDLYIARFDGSRTQRLTYSPEGEGSPRFSPDGKYISYTSSRGVATGRGSQVFLLDRSGGEPQKLTDVNGGVGGYEWSPDGKRLVLTVQDPDPDANRPPAADTTRPRTPSPVVIDRYQFKQDGQGYLGNRRTHLFLFDIESKKLDQLTTGRYNETNPSWSPDGQWIAFVSSRAEDPDKANDSNIYVVEARLTAEPRQLTKFEGPDGGRPAWSPDGKWIAFLQGSEPKYYAYGQNKVAVVPVEGGDVRLLTASLDRSVGTPVWRDATELVVQVEDDRANHLARVKLADGALTRIVEGRRTVSSFAMAPNGVPTSHFLRIGQREPDT